MDSQAEDDEIFLNGEEQNQRDNNLLHPEDNTQSEGGIPRRSSLVKDASHRACRNKKTVSFSSMPTEKKIANAPDCLNYMQQGIECIKVRSNSRQYHRLFTLDKNLTEIRWQPTSKKPHKARIPIETVKEVRVGKNTDVLRNQEVAGIYPDECAFSIIYGDSFDSLDLIANTPDEANIWVTGLTWLLSMGKDNTSPDAVEERLSQQMRDQWLLEVFKSADQDKCGVLDEYEVIELMKKLNKNITTRQIQQKMKELQLDRTQNNENNRGRLDSDDFASIFKDITTRPEIYFLLVRYSSNADYMSVDDLLLFLEAEQGMAKVTKDKCLEIINTFEPSKEGRTKGVIGIDGFTAYLLSEECDIFDVEHQAVCHDMRLPLSHYFIASSYNTYLMEDQLKGPSSVDGYIRALRKGCRFVALDCWDGPTDDPIIYHGHTLTSKISFRSVIEAINEHAFAVSEYPVIVYIENHCSIKQQQLMAHYLITIFGDKLVRVPVEKDCQFLPSPEALKHRIIIKLHDNDNTEGYVTDEEENTDVEKKKNNKREGSVKKHKLASELSDLVIYCKSVRFEDFHNSATQQHFSEVCSFSESSALKLANACPEDFVQHNKKFLSRVYPNGMRVDSSNFNPQDVWNCGCQIVTMNYQTPGLMMDLNDGHFLKNGGCGYVLKPAIMRDEIAFFSANTRDVIPGVSPQILHIKIISGYNFPKPKGSGAKGDTTDPYVMVEIFGIPADCAEERTKTVPHNGLNPIFDESFEFQINLPELALVRFAVLDDEFIGDEFIGQHTIPFECMQTGYRHVCMYSNTGDLLENCTLFVHIAITNKRGGGTCFLRRFRRKKPQRRGMSVKKGKKTREYTVMKNIGAKQIDDTFKLAMSPLREGTDLRDNVMVTLSAFKEACGLSPISNIKQCIRMLASRITTTGDNVKLVLIMRAGYPNLEATGTVPEIYRKALVLFDDLISECKHLINEAESVYEKIIQCQQRGLEWYEELHNLCQQAGLKGKKLVKATENFAWNIRVLKGQADLLRQAKKECHEYIQQVQEAAHSLGLIRTSQKTATL
ncbi:inactive phospholipase C-like protein 2 isoform X2 [Lineus longissimus]|uniref:inactive phospholipase C-like protein 2 isoform X2 n=1 Tax=Lineus longissimus TaxID=88925 RepID=UPI00315DC66C